MDDQQQFCLRWNDFQTNMVASFKHLRDEKSFTDVTIACEGQSCKAHKMILSACSPYFKVNINLRYIVFQPPSSVMYFYPTWGKWLLFSHCDLKLKKNIKKVSINLSHMGGRLDLSSTSLFSYWNFWKQQKIIWCILFYKSSTLRVAFPYIYYDII